MLNSGNLYSLQFFHPYNFQLQGRGFAQNDFVGSHLRSLCHGQEQNNSGCIQDCKGKHQCSSLSSVFSLKSISAGTSMGHKSLLMLFSLFPKCLSHLLELSYVTLKPEYLTVLAIWYDEFLSPFHS